MDVYPDIASSTLATHRFLGRNASEMETSNDQAIAICPLLLSQEESTPKSLWGHMMSVAVS